MASYFTEEHFKLLERWKGQKSEEFNEEQSAAYDALKGAYDVTESWARELQKNLFPEGFVHVIKRPTNQGNHFSSYNWAKIYPSSDAPKELAFTVGIDAVNGFVVKLDTVGVEDSSPVRRSFLRLRSGEQNASALSEQLTAVSGLAMSLDELVTWSSKVIEKLNLRYDEVVTELGMEKKSAEEKLLENFDAKRSFKKARAAWSSMEKNTFYRLAAAAHTAGMDWWHLSKGNTQVRFGRKNPGKERATTVVGVIQGFTEQKISFRKQIGELEKNTWMPLTQELIEKIEQGLQSSGDARKQWPMKPNGRSALWPDELEEDPAEEGEEIMKEEEDPPETIRYPINRIYYGPPGTGKTYELIKMLEQDYEQPLVSLSSEQWRSQFVAQKISGLKWWEICAAALYDLGEEASINALLDHYFVKSKLGFNLQAQRQHVLLRQLLPQPA